MSVTYTELPGLLTAIEAAGHWIVHKGGVFMTDDDAAVQAIITSYDPLIYVQQQQLAAAANEKWLHMAAGHTTASAGIPLATDPQSLALITSLYNAAQVNPNGTFSFKDRAGNFQALTSAQVSTLYQDMANWVQSFFTYEHTLVDQIKAATSWQMALAIDVTAGWPANS
ncbi:MAG TPA: hypothetical protein PLD10_15975 [Rhodopila sp.]|nr:hypothetical protein [Rhodopila sp.]